MTTMRRTRQKSLPRTQHSTHLGPTKISGTESEGRSTPTLSRTSRSSDATRSSDSGTSSGGEHRRGAKEGAKEREKDGSKDTTQRRWQKFGRKDKTRTAMSPNQRHMVTDEAPLLFFRYSSGNPRLSLIGCLCCNTRDISPNPF